MTESRPFQSLYSRKGRRDNLLFIMFHLKKNAKYFASTYLLRNKVCFSGGTVNCRFNKQWNQPTKYQHPAIAPIE